MDRKETNMTEPNPWQAPEQPVPAPALPQAGEAVLECGWRFEAAEIAKNRIASVRIERVKAPEAEDGSSEAATE